MHTLDSRHSHRIGGPASDSAVRRWSVRNVSLVLLVEMQYRAREKRGGGVVTSSGQPSRGKTSQLLLLCCACTANQLASGARKRQVSASAPLLNASDGRGWRAVTKSRFDNDAVCDIDRLPMAKAAVAFESFYRGLKPLLIEGVGAGLPGGAFSRDQLVTQHGDRLVSVGQSAEIPVASGTGTRSIPLREFVAAMEQSEDQPSTEPPYVFDKGDFLNAQQTNFVEGSATLGDQLAGVIPAWLTEGPSFGGYFLTMGGAESGVQFHKHNDGWNLLISGRKSWFLYPPTAMPSPSFPPQYLPIRDWVDTFLSGLRGLSNKSNAFPIQCIQQENEVLYVPEGWYHATVNLGNTVAVASQRTGSLHEVHELWSTAKEFEGAGDYANALAQWDAILSIDPNHAEALYARGITLFHLDRLDDAIVAMQQSTNISEYHAESAHNLGVFVMRKAFKQLQYMKSSDVQRSEEAALRETASSNIQYALQMLTRSRKLNPFYLEPLLTLREIYTLLKRKGELRTLQSDIEQLQRRFPTLDSTVQNHEIHSEL